MVVLHMQEGGIIVRLAVAVAVPASMQLPFIFLQLFQCGPQVLDVRHFAKCAQGLLAQMTGFLYELGQVTDAEVHVRRHKD